MILSFKYFNMREKIQIVEFLEEVLGVHVELKDFKNGELCFSDEPESQEILHKFFSSSDLSELKNWRSKKWSLALSPNGAEAYVESLERQIHDKDKPPLLELAKLKEDIASGKLVYI
jgi:hypothetical protein